MCYVLLYNQLTWIFREADNNTLVRVTDLLWDMYQKDKGQGEEQNRFLGTFVFHIAVQIRCYEAERKGGSSGMKYLTL